MKQDNERTDMANDAESGGEFVLVVFWQYGTHDIIWLAVMSNSVSEKLVLFHIHTVVPVIVV